MIELDLLPSTVLAGLQSAQSALGSGYLVRAAVRLKLYVSRQKGRLAFRFRRRENEVLLELDLRFRARPDPGVPAERMVALAPPFFGDQVTGEQRFYLAAALGGPAQAFFQVGLFCLAIGSNDRVSWLWHGGQRAELILEPTPIGWRIVPGPFAMLVEELRRWEQSGCAIGREVAVCRNSSTLSMALYRLLEASSGMDDFTAELKIVEDPGVCLSLTMAIADGVAWVRWRAPSWPENYAEPANVVRLLRFLDVWQRALCEPDGR